LFIFSFIEESSEGKTLSCFQVDLKQNRLLTEVNKTGTWGE